MVNIYSREDRASEKEGKKEKKKMGRKKRGFCREIKFPHPRIHTRSLFAAVKQLLFTILPLMPKTRIKAESLRI